MHPSQFLSGLEDDALWYKDAIIYEVHVRAFSDSNADGMGDFRGLADKLDYLEDLGVTALWLLPFFPSPWKDDGYDISDFRTVHPSYGTLRDFQTFLKRSSPARLTGHHGAGRQPYLRPARVVSTIASATPFPLARLLRLERHAGQIRRHAHHFQRFRALQLELGSGREGLLLASLLLASAGSEFR